MLSAALACGALVCALPLSEARAQRVERGARAGTFDFYVLALSWSPGFCEIEGRADRRDQCSPGRKYGFVVHGLWPQYERGYPRDCAAMPRVPSREAMAVAAGVFPEQGLARHQWRAHGTCSGKTPEAYFRDTARARDKVTIPPALRALPTDRRIAPAEVERAFIAANPGLQSDMIAAVCQRGRLKEVRICLSRDLSAFRACPEVDRSGCRDRSLTVDAPE
ncbi:MAG: ribonuclease T2 family protein [Pseudochelatococcus sp.]|jgi:ribonuclease T2